jgi:hypothetical protein
MTRPAHSALVRDDMGGLVLRRFPTAEAATEAAQARELTQPTGKGWTPARLGKELGLSKRTINRRCEADLLPHVDHGTPGRPRRIIPHAIVKLVKIYGLAGVGRMRQAGQI